MGNLKLKDRISGYEEAAQFKLLNRVPLIITINGRSFSKVTSLLEKPFSKEFAQCMYSCLIRLIQEIDGAVFGYSFNDEIVIVVRNDQNLETAAWYDNQIQKIVSITSSLVTLYFNNYANSIDMNVHGEAAFTAQVFAVPNETEAINVMISKQQQAFQTAVQSACLYELIKKFNKNDIKEMLSGTSYDEKINLLSQECGINFNDYPLAFRRGVACYRSPQVVQYNGTESIKNKWVLDAEIPIFTREHSFLSQIFHTGNDILRKE